MTLSVWHGDQGQQAAGKAVELARRLPLEQEGVKGLRAGGLTQEELTLLKHVTDENTDRT
jgi:hypothetical protein